MYFSSILIFQSHCSFLLTLLPVCVWERETSLSRREFDPTKQSIPTPASLFSSLLPPRPSRWVINHPSTFSHFSSRQKRWLVGCSNKSREGNKILLPTLLLFLLVPPLLTGYWKERPQPTETPPLGSKEWERKNIGLHWPTLYTGTRTPIWSHKNFSSFSLNLGSGKKPGEKNLCLKENFLFGYFKKF